MSKYVCSVHHYRIIFSFDSSHPNQVFAFHQCKQTNGPSVWSTGQNHHPPVTDVTPDDLGEAVAPEKAAQHHACLSLAPAELLCQADRTNGHGYTGTVQQAGPQQQHDRPDSCQWPVQSTNVLIK